MQKLFLAAAAVVGLSFASSSALALQLAEPTLSNSINGGSLNVASPGFTINLNYTTSATPAQMAAFSSAKATWESWITGYKINDIANNSLTINVTLAPDDGPGGVLGSAAPTHVKTNAAQNAASPTYLYAQTGEMDFDTADVPALISNGSFTNVVLHEMGHVLGIGTLWSSSAVGFGGRQELYVDGSGQYTGAFGIAAYNLEFGQTGTSVPVELQGGGGTANGHWDENLGGGSNTGRVSSFTGLDMRYELMTGWLNSPAFASQLTIQSMQDLGYTTIAIPEPTTLAAIGLVAFTVVRRSRK